MACEARRNEGVAVPAGSGAETAESFLRGTERSPGAGAAGETATFGVGCIAASLVFDVASLVFGVASLVFGVADMDSSSAFPTKAAIASGEAAEGLRNVSGGRDCMIVLPE